MSNEPPITMSSHAQNPNVLKVARDLYATYCASSEGKNYQGLPRPAWNALTEATRRHWYTVAKRVCAFTFREDGSGQKDFGFSVAALELNPSEYVLGHLRDPAQALETWRTYATE